MGYRALGDQTFREPFFTPLMGFGRFTVTTIQSILGWWESKKACTAFILEVLNLWRTDRDGAIRVTMESTLRVF